MSNGEGRSKMWVLDTAYTCKVAEQQMSQCISDLLYTASCFFIPSQYDVYWPLSNAALSGVAS
jgi:hypothetical protein